MLCQVGGRVQSHNNAYEDWSIGSKDDDERNFKSDQRNCKAKEKNWWHVKIIFWTNGKECTYKKIKDKETTLFKMDNYDLFVLVWTNFLRPFTMQ